MIPTFEEISANPKTMDYCILWVLPDDEFL